MNLSSAMRQFRRTQAAVAAPADRFARPMFPSNATVGFGAGEAWPSFGPAETTTAWRADSRAKPPEVGILECSSAKKDD
jgi:hypothetical protein